MVRIVLKRNREESLLRFHPWVFSGAIAQIQGSPAEGDVVAVYAADGSFLAIGHYQIGSIAVRVLSFEYDTLPADFWETSLRKALAVRVAAGLERRTEVSVEKCHKAGSAESTVTNCYRLVHGEGDNLPGLIIDYYDGVCVMQAHSVGMFRAKKQICDALRAVYGDALKAVYDKSSGTAPFKAGLELVDGYLYKADGFEDQSHVVLENGHKFIVNWTEGQKTGFFLDQRENRALVGRMAAGRRVLNLFCYTGGFSIYALAGGALHVDSVDSSARALALVDKNVELNGFDASMNESFCTDAIEFLRNSPQDKYDLIIVDPPAFAKHRGALGNALRAYQRLNAAAIAKVAPGGLVFCFSCSQVVTKEDFALAVFSAAAQTGRRVRILDRLNQPADHAVNIYHPEGEYLKGLLLYVE
ncbi:MAG: class I SAM-dependent rRNA methyltransferase [Bacteroidales bacterium]|nr:class I SAM-dependent rRNA methyltransferase [Bacteroidales bacterium]